VASIEQITEATIQAVFVTARAKPINKQKKHISENIKNLKSSHTNNITEENKMKNQPKSKSKKLVCPKAGTATSSPE